MLRQLINDLDESHNKAFGELERQFTNSMNEIQQTVQLAKNQIACTEGFFNFRSPSSVMKSGGKKTPFLFNSNHKRTPIISPHRTPTQLKSPSSITRNGPLGLRNLDQENNILRNAVELIDDSIRSPLRKRKSSRKQSRMSEEFLGKENIDLPKENPTDFAPITVPQELEKIAMDTTEFASVNASEDKMELTAPILAPQQQTEQPVQPVSAAQEVAPETITLASEEQAQPIIPAAAKDTQPIEDDGVEIVVVPKKTRQPRRNRKKEPSPPPPPEEVVDLTTGMTAQILNMTISDEETPVTAQPSAQILNPNPEYTIPNGIVVKEEILSPIPSRSQTVETFDSAQFFKEQSSVIHKPCVVKIEKHSPLPERSSDAFVAFEISEDEDSDIFALCNDKENEDDVCTNLDFECKQAGQEIQPERKEVTEDLISDTQNLFSKFHFAGPNTLKSLEEKINSLKSLSPEKRVINIEPIQQQEPTTSKKPSLQLSEPPMTPLSSTGATEHLGQLSIHKTSLFSPIQLSPPPFEDEMFITPTKESSQNEKEDDKESADLLEPTKVTPEKMETITPPPSLAKQPPTVSHHGRFKAFTPKLPETKLSSDNYATLPEPNIIATNTYVDPFTNISKSQSVDIIDIEEFDQHKRKFDSKISSDSSDFKRLKLSEVERLSISSVNSISSISSTNSSIAPSSSFMSNIVTGVKSFMLKANPNKQKQSNSKTDKKAISSIKLAEAAKKQEEDRKNQRKEKLEKQLALHKKKKEQEDLRKQEEEKRQQKPGKSISQKTIESRTSTSKSTIGSLSKPTIVGPQPRPVNSALPRKQLPQIPQPQTNNGAPTKERYSSYELSDEYDSSEEDEDAKRRRQHKRIPTWAQGENLKKNLRRTARIDPDRIFAVVKTCNLEDIFAGSTNQQLIARFRSRTSSSNWTHDHFTLDEEETYREEMGFLY